MQLKVVGMPKEKAIKDTYDLIPGKKKTLVKIPNFTITKKHILPLFKTLITSF